MYTDGIFDVSPKHGFLPIKDPLPFLPETYNSLQSIINLLPQIINLPNKIVESVSSIPDYSDNIKDESDPFIFQALFRAYTFVASAYTLEQSHQFTLSENTSCCPHRSSGYGPARRILPSNIAKPLVLVAEKLNVYPWLDYHYAYSLGNYVKKDPNGSLDWNNLEMACSFTGGQDEVGFIMLHVYINELSPFLIDSIVKYQESGRDSKYLASVANVMKNINKRRREMWEASRPERYNDFRVFIMGIKGNTALFGDGLVYDGCFDNKPQQFRGQTGAQDNIIPTVDIFSGVVDYYPENKLTEYLMDLRTYRPVCIQEFFKDLQRHYSARPVFLELEKTGDVNGLLYLLQIVDEIYLFRNGHWNFVQRYIMANTKFENATGGTPITSWLVNQIDAVLRYEEKIMLSIDDLSSSLEDENLKIYNKLKETLSNKKKLLLEQVEEMRNKEYDVDKIYEKNKEYLLEDKFL